MIEATPLRLLRRAVKKPGYEPRRRIAEKIVAPQRENVYYISDLG
jgi:hypothetical protein